MRNFSQHFAAESAAVNDDGEPFVPAWIGFDLDGTLAVHTKWQGHQHIGEPIPQMIAKVKEHLANGDTAKIFTARVSCEKEELNEIAREVIRAFCLEHIGQELDITNKKDRGMIKLYDDRAVQVVMNTGEIVEAPKRTAEQTAQFHADLKKDLSQE